MKTIPPFPYIAAVAVPLEGTEQDIAANIYSARWQPLGRFPDEESAKAAVAAFIADHEHDAYFISAKPTDPLYQDFAQRLDGDAQ